MEDGKLLVAKLLVANRGEIACRVFRTARRLGIATVAVVAPDDLGSLHARSADELERVGSYLWSEEHIQAALRSGADAIHPGYGFLAESGDFAEAVGAAGLLWIGPPPEALRAGGDKIQARRIALEAGVPVVPGGTPEDVGFPLLVKAAAGGGGRGMRVVRSRDELDAAVEAAAREAKAAFRDDRLLFERYLERPRHVEIQLLADAHGTVLALGERECSVQRRHQKVLEETPSVALDAELRARMSDAAISFARAVGYVGAGTAEFVLEGRGFHFLELNGRIQVEHPVTEAVTGLDLVEQQIRVARGEPLDLRVEPSGHAVEVRLYAEHPRTFLPQAGRIERLRLPASIRVDAGVEEGDDVGTAYDPLLAKLIAHGATREQALDRLAAALAETEVGGVTTNLPFLRWLVRHAALRAAETTTAFLVDHPPLSRPPERLPGPEWRGAWRLNLPSPPPAPPPDVDDPAHRHGGGATAASSSVVAPMPGTVVRVLVAPGDDVEARSPLVVLEAMKMETPLVAPYAATVTAVHVGEGDRVVGGAPLVELGESSHSDAGRSDASSPVSVVLPAIVAHADWSSAPPGRRLALATLRDGRYVAEAPRAVGDPRSLLDDLRRSAAAGTVFAGFDFPIGVPRAWARAVGVASFRQLLPKLGRGEWEVFFEPARQPDEIELRRPFYPARPGGTSQAQLVAALGVSSMDDLLRRCDRRTDRRRAACAIFWTLGANQVGRAAISGWRELLQPADAELALWPFDGTLEELLATRDVVVAETYPAETSARLGLTGAKSDAAARSRNADVLVAEARRLDVTLDAALLRELNRGFDSDDSFDAVVGLLGMLAVVLGAEPTGEPLDDPALAVEGWILGQPAGSP